MSPTPHLHPATHRPVLALLLFSASCCMEPARAEINPVELLASSGQAVSAPDQLSFEFSAIVRVVMDEQQQNTQADYVYARRPDGRFFFKPISDEMVANSDGVAVQGTGEVTLTHIPALGRHTLSESEAGIRGFIESPLSRGIGNGLGGLALSLIDAETSDTLTQQVTASEYLGEEELDGAPTHHCRYTIDDDLSVDIWFDTGDAPRPVQLRPDLSGMVEKDPSLQQFENFEYTVTFRYKNWSEDELDAERFSVVEPDGSQLVDTFFGRANRTGPHPLLGDPAPPIALATLDGDEVNLGDHLGKDVLLLDFWATWCPPCIAAMPRITNVAEDFAERGVVFYAVNQQETPEQVNQFLERSGLSPPVLLDSGELGNAFRIDSLPTTVLIGKDGRVQVVHIGFGANLEEMLTGDLESLVAGTDLAGEELAQVAAEEEARLERYKTLRDKLDR